MKGTVRGGNDPGHSAAGSCLPTGADSSAIGRLVLPRPRRDITPSPEDQRVADSDAAGKTGSVSFTGTYIVKKNIRRRPFHRVKNPLQSDLAGVYNFPTIHGVCVLYAIGGGSRYRRVVSCRTEPPGSTSSMRSGDKPPPGGNGLVTGKNVGVHSFFFPLEPG